MAFAHETLPATVSDAARNTIPDFYLSALLAPRPVRDDLVMLAAYVGEVQRVPLIVADAPLAEIRLQWWREAIERATAGARTGNPVADAMVETMLRRGLSREDVLAPLAAHEHLLARGCLTETAELEAYLDGTAGAHFRLAAMLIGVAEPPMAIVRAAAQAYGRARIALDLPIHLSRGRWPLPLPLTGGRDPRGAREAEAAVALSQATDTLAGEARAALAALRQTGVNAIQSLVAALRPLALVEPYFKALQRPGRDGLRQPADIAPLERVARLWLATWRGVV